MVKINLLPVRASRKQESARQQLLYVAAGFCGLILACVVAYWFTCSKIATAKQEIQQAEKQIADLKVKIGEIDNLKKLQAEVKRKLEVLDQLRKNKTGPAKRLARICDVIPERLWLTKFTESNVTLALSGVAYTEELIADFMRGLMATGEFSSVDLQVSEQYELAGVKTKKFELLCTLIAVQPKPAEPGAPTAKK